MDVLVSSKTIRVEVWALQTSGLLRRLSELQPGPIPLQCSYAAFNTWLRGVTELDSSLEDVLEVVKVRLITLRATPRPNV